jgi:hypothetical protein
LKKGSDTPEKSNFSSLYGVWADETRAEDLISEIKGARKFNSVQEQF